VPRGNILCGRYNRWDSTTIRVKELSERLFSTRRFLEKELLCYLDSQAALKVVYLAIDATVTKWSMPISNWKAALNRFMIEFPERMPETL
jgi:transposase-like protein